MILLFILLQNLFALPSYLIYWYVQWVDYDHTQHGSGKIISYWTFVKTHLKHTTLGRFLFAFAMNCGFGLIMFGLVTLFMIAVFLNHVFTRRFFSLTFGDFFDKDK